MSAHLSDIEEKILKILQDLAEESARGIPIVVEGKKDVETLRVLGIEGKIIMAKSGGKTSLDLIFEVEESKAREVILLLDFDRRGEEFTLFLERHLEKAGVKPNTTFWRKIRAIVRKDVKDVEGLNTYMETLKRKIYNS